MLERLTRGRYRSAPHRLVNRSGAVRLSFPLFYDPDFGLPVEPLPPLTGESPQSEADTPRWDGRRVHDADGTYGNYLLAKIGRVFQNLR